MMNPRWDKRYEDTSVSIVHISAAKREGGLFLLIHQHCFLQTRQTVDTACRNCRNNQIIDWSRSGILQHDETILGPNREKLCFSPNIFLIMYPDVPNSKDHSGYCTD